MSPEPNSAPHFSQGDSVVVEATVAHVTGDAVFVQFTPPAAGWPVLSRVSPNDLRTLDLHRQAQMLRAIAEGQEPWSQTHDRDESGNCCSPCRGCTLVQIAERLEGKQV